MVHLIGNVGRDPEVRFFPNGDPVANVSIGVSETWKDKSSGERKERTEWVPLVFTGPLAKVVGDYVKKGSQIFVSGKLATRKWQDKDGNDRYTTEVRCTEMQMLGKREGGAAAPAAAPAPRQPAPRAAAGVADEDCPF